MANEDTVAFTVRIPRTLCEQVEMRRRINKRTRNSEIHFLIEAGIQAGVERDRQLIESLTRKDPQ
jgi:hypothetical protein